MVHVAPTCGGLADCEPTHWTHWLPLLHKRESEERPCTCCPQCMLQRERTLASQRHCTPTAVTPWIICISRPSPFHEPSLFWRLSPASSLGRTCFPKHRAALSSCGCSV